MPCFRVSAILLSCLLAAALAGCSRATAGIQLAEAAALTAGLPAVAGLDAWHGASGVAGWPLRVQEPLEQLNSDHLGAGLLLTAPANGIAYALYKIAQPAGALLSIQLSGSGALWLVAADYAGSHWALPTPVAAGQAELNLSALGDATSPGGFIYCAVVCAQDTSGVLDRLTLLYSTASTGSSYYVAPGGSDDGTGAQGDPWATLQHAADQVQPGDTVLVAAGAYAGFHLQTSGDPGAPIRFLADPGVQITTDNGNTPDGINIEDWSGAGIGYVEVAGFTVNGRTRTGIRIVGSDTSPAHHIIIRDNSCDQNGVWGILTGFVDDMLIESNTCTNSGEQHGIYFSNSGDYVTIRNNTCAHNNGCGIHMNGDASMGGDGIISGALVECNTIYDNGAAGGSGINCDGVQRSTIRNNLLYNNHASGISLYQIDGGDGARGNAVLHNSVVMAEDSRWCLNLMQNSTDTVVFNNVFYNAHSWHGSITLETYPLSGLISDFNAVMERFTPDDGSTVLDLAGWQAATGQDTHSFVATPEQMFADFPNDDYMPSLLSPLRDTATALYAPALDLAGTQRPRHGGCDIGAYEGS